MIYIATDNYKDGFPLSKAYDDTIYQKGNGEYYLKFRFPVDRLGVWKHLTCETILKADDTRGLQLFKIKKINKINGYIRVYCKHISDDLNYIGVDKLSVTNATGRRVMEALAGSTTEPHNFIFNSDVATMHTLNLSNTTAGKILSKDKHSIIGQWGGELVRDNFLVDLKARAGVDTEILFMNKKNVKNLDNAISTENLTTRLKLSVEKEHEGKKQTITATVDSPNINAYPRIYTNYLKVTNNNITTQEELIEYGKKYFRDKLVDFPTDNLTVNVIDKNQEQVRLFDTVWFRNIDFNIDKRLKVVAYEYSPMAKRYKKISFGALKVSNLSQIKSLSQLEDKIEEKVNESFVDAFKIQKNLSELLKSDRKGIEDKLVELEEKSKGALEVKKALFEADGTIPEVVKTKILDAVEGDIGRLKTIITEAELIKAIQAKLNYADIKNALIDKAFINQIISDEKFTQQFEDGEVTTQNIFIKLKDSIKSNISKEFVTKDGVRKLVNDLTIDADGIRQITQQESSKVFERKKAELKGVSSYLHKKYSDYPDGRNMSDNSTLKYIGIYTGDKARAPTNASEYSWTKIRGEDGARGRDGEPGRDGNNGRDGVSNYIHRKYSDYSSGYAMDDNSSRKYIGIYTGTSSTPPTTASAYLWSKIKGEDGANGTPGTKGADGRTSYLHTAYSNSATGDRDFSTTNSTNKEYIGTYSDFDVTDSNDYRRYKWIKIKGENGANGRNGTDGHSLTASLWFTGGYVNNVTNGVRLNLIVYYDGREIRDFKSNITYKGGGISNWATQSNPTISLDNTVVNKFWSDGEKDGTTLFALATVTYNGLQTVADARLDNVPDVRLVNETIKKYKTFESTLEGFTSVVGEIDTKVFSKSYFKNNLNNEDVEKEGNDLYFNTKENLKANEYYTILADLENVPAVHRGYIYGASDGGDNKVLQNGLNYWVVKYPSDQTKINLYPLGANTKVRNVRIYKGDFRVKKDDERENLYSNYGHDDTGFLHLFLNKNKINGNVYLVKFDASNFTNGARWDVYNRVGYNQENLTQVFKTKDNEFIFTINDNTTPDRIYLRIARRTSPDISNVEIYDVSTDYVKNSQVSKLESSIKQTKDEIDLKVSKDNVIASINASVETTGNGTNQGVIKINADKVDIKGALKAFQGDIGTFSIGGNKHTGYGKWITGVNQFQIGMSDGTNGALGTALWVNWGDKWDVEGKQSWYVMNNGAMIVNNRANINALYVTGDSYFTRRLRAQGDGVDVGGSDVYGTASGIGTRVIWWSQINDVKSSVSDERLKTNVKPTKINALETLNNIEMVEFNWIKDGGFEKIGAIAQQVQSVEKTLVVNDTSDKNNPSDYLRISYYNCIPYLIKAIQELSTENQQLKSQLKEMNERLTKLEDKINGNL